MPVSNYLENKLLDFLVRGQPFTPPASLYVTLCSGLPLDSSTGSNLPEMSGANFARKEIPSTSGAWFSTQGDNQVSNGVSGIVSNVNSILWENTGWSGVISAVAICDSGVNGNLWFYGSLATGVTVASGENVLYNSGKLSIQLD